MRRPCACAVRLCRPLVPSAGGMDEGLADPGECGIFTDFELSLRFWMTGWQAGGRTRSDPSVRCQREPAANPPPGRKGLSRGGPPRPPPPRPAPVCAHTGRFHQAAGSFPRGAFCSSSSLVLSSSCPTSVTHPACCRRSGLRPARFFPPRAERRGGHPRQRPEVRPLLGQAGHAQRARAPDPSFPTRRPRPQRHAATRRNPPAPPTFPRPAPAAGPSTGRGTEIKMRRRCLRSSGGATPGWTSPTRAPRSSRSAAAPTCAAPPPPARPVPAISRRAARRACPSHLPGNSRCCGEWSRAPAARPHNAELRVLRRAEGGRARVAEQLPVERVRDLSGGRGR